MRSMPKPTGRPRLPTRRPTTGRRNAANAASTKTSSANSTADRAIDILLLFTEERPTWLMAEIAAHFDMPRSTIYRYLASLRSYALIIEDDSGGYRLGPKIFPLAQAARAGTSILKVAQPYLDKLNREFGEAVTLYERVGHESIPLLRLESRHSVKMIYSRGQMLPWPAAASSKVLLAFAPPGDQEAILRLLVPVRFTRQHDPVASAAAAGVQDNPEAGIRVQRSGAGRRRPRRCSAHFQPWRGALLHHGERPPVPPHDQEDPADDRNGLQDRLGHHRRSQEN